MEKKVKFAPYSRTLDMAAVRKEAKEEGESVAHEKMEKETGIEKPEHKKLAAHHKSMADHHEKMAEQHEKAAEMHKEKGNTKEHAHHKAMAKHHSAMAEQHEKMAAHHSSY